jgi:hypothetical protein
MNRLIRLAAVLLLALSGLAFVSSGTALARQSDDCAGIEQYVADLEVAGTEMEATMEATDDSDMESWSSEEFTAAADMFEAAQETFDAIEPPAIAEEYHATILETFGMLGQMFDAMATAGIFGSLLFIEPLDELEVRSNAAAQAIEDTCGVVMEDVIEDEESAATPVAADTTIVEVTDESGDSTGSAGTGTRANPIPFGQTAKIHPDWEMTVISVTPDAADLIVTEDSFNEPPADGHQFFMATVRLTYIGETSDEFYVSDLNAVGQSAVSYNQFDDSCGSIPDELESRELFTGGTIEGNVCWSIETADVDSLVLYDSYDDDERVFLSLTPDGSESATPVAGGSFPSAAKAAMSGSETPEADQR